MLLIKDTSKTYTVSNDGYDVTCVYQPRTKRANVSICIKGKEYAFRHQFGVKVDGAFAAKELARSFLDQWTRWHVARAAK